MSNTIFSQTERLIIRNIDKTDAQNIYKYRSDKETNKYQAWIPDTIEDVYYFIENKIAKKINTPETWFQLGIIIKENSEFIGDIGIHFIDEENLQAEIGCTIAKKHQAKGYATEALRQIINFLFNDLKKHRIIGSVDPENINSIKLLKRLGFRKEAHFKKSIFDNGKWIDDVIYAILEEEWKIKI